MHPFMAAELPAFQLSTALQSGLLPLVVAAVQPEEVLQAYATLYLQEEVQLEGWARNVGSFARFLEMVSFSHAAVLNISNVARECQIERKTVAAYMEVLEDLLLAFRLPIFTRRARRQTSVHPKFYLLMPGSIARYARAGLSIALKRSTAVRSKDSSLSTSEPGSPMHNGIVRCISGARVRVLRSISLSMVREASGPSRSRTRPGCAPRICTRYKALSAITPECEPILLYRGTERLRIDGIWCVPGEEFLRQMHPAQGLTDWLH